MGAGVDTGNTGVVRSVVVVGRIFSDRFVCLIVVEFVGRRFC